MNYEHPENVYVWPKLSPNLHQNMEHNGCWTIIKQLQYSSELTQIEAMSVCTLIGTHSFRNQIDVHSFIKLTVEFIPKMCSNNNRSLITSTMNGSVCHIFLLLDHLTWVLFCSVMFCFVLFDKLAQSSSQISDTIAISLL